jgi:hypothetical protein
MSNIKHGENSKSHSDCGRNVPSIQSFTVCDCMCINLPLPGTDSLYVIWVRTCAHLAPYVRLAMDRHYNCVNRPSNCVERGQRPVAQSTFCENSNTMANNRLQLSLSATGLTNLAGILNTSDPLAVVTVRGDQPDNPPTIVGQTEV